MDESFLTASSVVDRRITYTGRIQTRQRCAGRPGTTIVFHVKHRHIGGHRGDLVDRQFALHGYPATAWCQLCAGAAHEVGQRGEGSGHDEVEARQLQLLHP